MKLSEPKIRPYNSPRIGGNTSIVIKVEKIYEDGHIGFEDTEKKFVREGDEAIFKITRRVIYLLSNSNSFYV